MPAPLVKPSPMTTSTGAPMPLMSSDVAPPTTPPPDTAKTDITTGAPETSTTDIINQNTDTGFSSSFLTDSDTALQNLNKDIAASIEKGRAAAETGIKTGAEIRREEIQANQAEGQRQITYAQERLGGAVILQRNVADFTANVKKFTSEIDRSLERLDIETENALATNNTNAWTALTNLKKDAIQQQLAMYDRAMDVYYKNATLAIQQHEQANKDLDTMLQWASLDNASPEDLNRISKETGFSVEQLQAMGANAQRTFNASMASKSGSVLFPAALVPWQGAVDEALTGGRTVAQAVQDAVTSAANAGVKLSDADIASLSNYAQSSFDKAKADLAFQEATKPTKATTSGGKTGGVVGAVSEGASKTFASAKTGVEIVLDALSKELFGG